MLPLKGREAPVAVMSMKCALQVQIQVPGLWQHLFVHIIKEDAGFLLKALKRSKFLVIMQKDFMVDHEMGH